MVVFEIILIVLIADFISGLFHWLEDAYGREDWPITGWLVTKPNILHHHNSPGAFGFSWFWARMPTKSTSGHIARPWKTGRSSHFFSAFGCFRRHVTMRIIIATPKTAITACSLIS